MLLGISFLEYRTTDATLFALRNDFYALLATNRAKHILNRLCLAPVVTEFIVKVLRKIEKSSNFESLPFLY